MNSSQGNGGCCHFNQGQILAPSTPEVRWHLGLHNNHLEGLLKMQTLLPHLTFPHPYFCMPYLGPDSCIFKHTQENLMQVTCPREIEKY